LPLLLGGVSGLFCQNSASLVLTVGCYAAPVANQSGLKLNLDAFIHQRIHSGMIQKQENAL